jgi:hypothetical protein
MAVSRIHTAKSEPIPKRVAPRGTCGYLLFRGPAVECRCPRRSVQWQRSAPTGSPCRVWSKRARKLHVGTKLAKERRTKRGRKPTFLMNPPASSKFIASLVHSTSAATAMSGGKCDRQISRRRLKSGSLNSIARLIRLMISNQKEGQQRRNAGMHPWWHVGRTGTWPRPGRRAGW